MGGFAGYYGQTMLHPLAIVGVILLFFATLALSRRLALAPLLIAATALPMSQRLVLGGVDFTLLRLLLLAYVLRMLFRGEWRGFVWNPMDTLVLLWTLSSTIIMTIHFGTSGALINRLGWSYDVLLAYFAARSTLQNWDDLVGLGRFAAILAIPVAGAFAFEWMTRYNMFGIFGGVPYETGIRDGRLRCQGPFAHPILAGTFWAAMMPLMWTALREGGWSRTFVYLGTVAALVIVASTASSTPVASALVAIMGGLMFRFRDWRRPMWIGMIFMAALLHFVVMEQPVWHLMARVDFVAGSTGWHRFKIMDVFINNFSGWFLTGESNPEKWHWFMRDITNQYVLEGLRGGLITLLIFSLVLVSGFRNVGLALGANPDTESGTAVRRQWIIWAAGVALFVHFVTFFGVSYFGQMIVIQYIQFAVAATVGSTFISRENGKQYNKGNPEPVQTT